ncbi:MAG TPA: DUF6132 family protein [bacterium]
MLNNILNITGTLNWIGMVIGAVLGGGYAYFLKCTSGTCPLTSRWWLVAIIGALLGLTWKK